MINEIITPATRHTLYLNEVISYKPLATRAISAGFGYVLKIFKATNIPVHAHNLLTRVCGGYNYNFLGGYELYKHTLW